MLTIRTLKGEDPCLSFDCRAAGRNDTVLRRQPVHALFVRRTAPSAGPYAIVETSGTQVWVQPDRYYDLNRINAEVDSTLTLENVLLVNDGKAATVGQPFVKGATVELHVMAHRRGPKVIVYKMRPKKKTRRKNGHRQELTRVMVKSISVGGKSLG